MKAPDTLVLKRAGLQIPKRDLVVLLVFILALIAVAIWVFYPLDLIDMARKRSEKFPQVSVELILELLAGAAGAWYMVRANRHERLFLDRGGIRYQSPLPGPLAALQPSWAHAWAQIQSAEVVVQKFGNAALVAMVLDAVTVKRRIAGRWVPADQKTAAPADLEESPLVEFMRRMGVKITTKTTTAGFALERNRASLGVAIAVPVLLVYAAADVALNTEAYAARPPYEIVATGGMVALLGGAIFLARSRVPAAELLALAMLLGIAVAAALYPGLLRVNQLTDADGLRTHEYRMKNWATWEPVDATLPALTFSDYYEYWSQFKPGARRQFLLRRGALGFYQIEMAPVNAQMRAYYERNP